MSKTALWMGSAIVCGLMGSFFWGVKGSFLVVDLLGAIASAVGSLLGGLFVGYIATRFMKGANERSKNVAYFCGVIFWSAATVFVLCPRLMH